MRSLEGSSAPRHAVGGGPAVCPHCWMVNPGAFRICARCGAAMTTFLQESAGLRRTAPVQSPVPVHAADRLSRFQRAVVGLFVAVLALAYLAHLLPQPRAVPPDAAVPVSPGGSP